MSYNSTLEGAEVQALLELIPNKVDKVSGKGLSTNDFTDADKSKLKGLENYDDTDIKHQIAGKQDSISDLSAIRSGASKGATAVQPSDLSAVATSGSYNDLSNKPSIPDSLSDLSSDSTHRTVTDSEKTTWNNKSNFSGSYNDLTNKPSIPAEQVNADWNATSGKARILNKPTIPASVTESTVSGWGFTKNTGTYSKPWSGIPKSDLASAVQTSLGKADTAVQPAAIANFADKTSYASQSGVTSATLQPNTFTDFGEVASLDVTLGSVASDAPLEKRMFGFQFTSGTTATTLTLPDTVKFPEDPTIEAGYTYQVTILNNRALITGWPNA